ncbi:MAG TPA: hypothetical protein VK072_02485 [Candidatus Avamphibacillus sp.]|nr:hypothetical protein [Candidatus Avamphibacillus sp.]
MWEQIAGYLPKKIVIVCTILSFLVPYSIFKINSKLHEIGDPPWKQEKEKDPPSSKRE